MKPQATSKATADGVPVFCAHDAVVDVVTLVPNPKNPNTHPDNQIQLLGRIIRQTGWRQAITVSKRSGFIVKGHGRLSAALLEGFKEVPVDYQHYDNEAQEYADLVADNRIAELSEIDNKMLADIFAEIDFDEIPTELTGYTEDELESLGVALSESLHTELTEPDEIPDTPEPEEVITQKGDLWILGRHRVMCGDSTDRETVELLIDGEKVDISFTSPPYNVGHNLGYDDTSKYENDDDNKNNYVDFLKQFTHNANDNSKYTFVNIQQLANNKIDLIEWLYEFKYCLCDTLIWDKGHAAPAMAHKVTNSCFEYIYVFNEKAKRSIGTKDFHGNVDNIVRIPPQRKNDYSDIHNATFPLELPTHIINNFTNVNDSILDLFGGTGTTLIAAESTGRTAYLMELDPKYVDVIVRRYIKTTGKCDVRLFRKDKELRREHFESIFTE